MPGCKEKHAHPLKQKNFREKILLRCTSAELAPYLAAMTNELSVKAPCTCPQCGKPVSGRTGKKFCSEACKNGYHNEMTRESRLGRSRIITALSHNHSILEKVLRNGILSIDLMALENMGFRPAYITGYTPARKGNGICRCFDISYCRSATRVYKIRKEEGF